MVQLRVANLFDEDAPIYYNTTQRPPDGNLRSPARVATPYLFSYQTLRSYSLSATVEF